MATTVTTWNKGKAPAGATGWNLTPDVRAGLESMNVIVPVADQAERDGITPPLGKYVGMAVSRADKGGLIEVWNGTTWLSPTKGRHAEFTAIHGGGGGTAGPGQWGLSVLTEDTTMAENNTFAAPGPVSKLTLTEVGCYSIHFKLGSTSNPGSLYVAIKNDADTYTHADGNNGNMGDWGATTNIPNLRVKTPGTNVLFGFRPSVAAPFTARITVQKISD